VSTSPAPRRGDIWWLDFDPTTGREQGGRQPALVLSADRFNASRRGLVVVAPLTTTLRGFAWHVEIEPPEGGLRQRSAVMVEQVRSVSVARLAGRLGAVEPATVARVATRLRLLFAL
jgi:mRNA interferase MazF